MPRKDTKLESEGAEFLVLGQLLIQGIPAYKPYTNLHGYDLTATWPETNRFARIQVKSRWAINALHFLVKDVDNCDFVVLVRLNRGYLYSASAKQAEPPEDPEYYVLSANNARSLIIDQERGWAKIRWQKQKFEDRRRRRDRIKKFLKMPETHKTSEGQTA
jgi:hypothetical protein